MVKKEHVEVVASHEALSVVSGWLGVAVEDALQEGAGEQADEGVRRPAFLGLGAKFLPHHKAVGFAGILDTKLKKRLEAGRKRSALQASEEAEAAGQQGGRQLAAGAGDESDEEEERGKARQVRQRQLPSKPAAAGDRTEDAGEENGLQGVGHTQQQGRAAHTAKQQQQRQQQHAQQGATQHMPGSRAAREALLLGAGRIHKHAAPHQQQQNHQHTNISAVFADAQEAPEDQISKAKKKRQKRKQRKQEMQMAQVAGKDEASPVSP